MPNKLKIFNTYTREVEEFRPIKDGEITIYCCGPTVYNFQHIGNFKSFINEDIIIRSLRYIDYKVEHVMNITDVGHLTGDNDEGEDKMAVAMRREGKKSYEIADYYTDIFFKDWDALNLLRPNTVCRASEHIEEMINLIKKIEANGFSYTANGNVYFDVSKFKNYGKLAKLDLSKLKAGSRVEIDKDKKNHQDFVLWFTRSKFTNQELQWDSPWGKGYPGWHIECSAMSMKYLGEKFDIHCGGIDHVPIHHTNEIAQSEAATGKAWVNYWMHMEFLCVDNEKMSKSSGGFITLSELIEMGFRPEDYRMFLLSGHYRQQLNFSKNALENAKRNIDKLRTQYFKLKSESTNKKNISEKYVEEFKAGILNDINTPQALASMWKMLSDDELDADVKLGTLLNFDLVFGFGIKDWKEETIDDKEAINLLEKRNKAREDKNWEESDRLRDELIQMGYKIEDSNGSSKLVKI